MSEENNYLELLQEQNELLEDLFENGNRVLDSLTKFEAISEVTEETKDEIASILNELNNKPLDLQVKSARLYELEKSYQEIYDAKSEELQDLHKKTFELKNTNIDQIIEYEKKFDKLKAIESKIGDLKEIEGVEIDSEMKKEDIIKILEIEKKKRASLTFINNDLLQPQVSNYEKEFNKWKKHDSDLDKFLKESINLEIIKVEEFNKSEGI